MAPPRTGQIVTYTGRTHTTFYARIQRDGHRTTVKLIQVPNADANKRATKARVKTLLGIVRAEHDSAPVHGMTRGQLIRYRGKVQTTFRLRYLVNGKRESVVLCRVKNAHADDPETREMVAAMVREQRVEWGTATIDEQELVKRSQR